MALLSIYYEALPGPRRSGRPGTLAPLLLLLSLLPFAPRTSSQNPALPPRDSAIDLFSRVIAQQKKSEVDLDVFERIQRAEARKPPGEHALTDVRFLRLFPNGTGLNKIPLSPDGTPPPSPSYRADLARLEQYLVWILQDGSGQREAIAKAEKKRKERFELIDATHQAFVFTLEGKEVRGDRTLLRYSMTPRKDYKPTSRLTTLFTKVRGTVWVDEQTSQLAKIDGQVTEDISLALFLAKVNKGSHFMQERYEIAPGVWAPTFEQYDFDGRRFFSTISIHERSFYTDYKRVGPPREAVERVRAELGKLPAENRQK